jgi:hypothetical protein
VGSSGQCARPPDSGTTTQPTVRRPRLAAIVQVVVSVIKAVSFGAEDARALAAFWAAALGSDVDEDSTTSPPVTDR